MIQVTGQLGDQSQERELLESFVAQRAEIAQLKMLQNAMRQLLGQFLGFWPWGVACDPDAGMGRSLQELRTNWQTIQQTGGDLPGFSRTQALLASVDLLDHASSRPWDRLAAALLCAFYQEFDQQTALPAVEESSWPVCPAFDPQDYRPEQRPYLNPFGALQRTLDANRDRFVGAYLFGSYASQDFIPGWSDADVLLVLDRSCFQDERSLLETRALLLQQQSRLFEVDPLQLHGFFTLTWADLGWYPQSYFPLVLFDFSRSLLDPGASLVVREREDSQERLEIFRQQTDYIIRLAHSNWIPGSPVERKVFFHKVFTYPLYFLQALGIHCYKKHSFEIARATCPEFDWACIDRATEWMQSRQTDTRLEGLIRRLARMKPYASACLLQSRLYRLANRVRVPMWQVSDEEIRQLIADMARLATQCSAYIDDQSHSLE